LLYYSKLDALTSNECVSAASFRSSEATPHPALSLTSRLLSASPSEDPAQPLATDKERSSMEDTGSGPYDSSETKGDADVTICTMDSGHGQEDLSMPRVYGGNVSVVCDEGDVVLECVEKDDQRHSGDDNDDDDCDYDDVDPGRCRSAGAGGNVDVGVVYERRHHGDVPGANSVEVCIRDDEWRDFGEKSDNGNTHMIGFSSFSGTKVFFCICVFHSVT